MCEKVSIRIFSIDYKTKATQAKYQTYIWVLETFGPSKIEGDPGR